jgi:putative membrane protein (TIGR04086 family)
MFRYSAVTGFVVSLVFVFGAMVVLAMIVASGKMESLSLPGMLGLHTVAVFIGSLVSGRKAGSRGWLHGVLNAVLYCALFGLIGFLGFDRGIPLSLVWLFALTALFGIIGGSIGVNRSR